MYTALSGQCPEHIKLMMTMMMMMMKDVLVPVASDLSQQQLRSAARSYFTVPFSRTKSGSRAISTAGPKVWNHLPQSVHLATSVCQFK